ncbi:hypothetical protein ACLQ3C_06255 [Gordonia sp. DT30]|uniref:hypothetical protein n=1 Tax=unclassified Gordonia (in: high G+C Gram-positive bacteria) TaxID=2657482 RepID=UPI003CEF4295
MSHEFRLDPEAVIHFGKHLWRVSDSLADIDAAGILATGAAACPGTDLERGLKRHAEREHEAVSGLSTNFDEFGNGVKLAVDRFLRADSEFSEQIASPGESRL